MTRAAYELALAGILARYPSASERERFLRFAAVRPWCRHGQVNPPDAAALSDLDGADLLS